MLAPDSRTLLIDQLAPPPGTRIDAAVATTFTLDLAATLLPALAFTGFHLSGGVSDPVATLESVRATANRVDVFCQAGAIVVPNRAPDLLAFLESVVHPVRAPRSGLFHPKVWFIRYVDGSGAVSFRLLVLTRNLTMDASWDIAVRLDSERVADRPQPGSAPLHDFIASLPGRCTLPLRDDRLKRITRLADDAARIVWEAPEWVDDVRLHLLDQGRTLTPVFGGSRHLVVSPYLDAAGIARVSPKGTVEILSRAQELDRLDAATASRLTARVLDDLAVVQEVQGSRLGGQLHAKMYIVEQAQNWSKSHVFIGSANATGAAFSNNTEFMVELRGHKNNLGIDRFLGGDGTFMPLTEPYKPLGDAAPEPDDLAQRDLDNALRRVAGTAFRVEVEPTSDPGFHELRLRSEAPFTLGEHWSASVELLTLGDYAAPVSPGTALDAVVPDVATADITPFLSIRVTSPTGHQGSTVVVAELVGDPDDRLDVVLARQIDTPDKFLRFLFFLLSLGNPAALASLETGSGSGLGGSPSGTGGSGVLELVLGALAASPSALDDLDALVRRLSATEVGRSSLPEGFLEFWSVVREAVALDRVGPA